MRLVLPFLCVLVILLNHKTAPAEIAEFRVGDNSFEIEFVTVGDPGNPPDERTANIDPDMETPFPRVVGSVEYVYQIAKFEVGCNARFIGIQNGYSDSDNLLGCSPGPEYPARFPGGGIASQFVNWMNFISGYHSAYKLSDGDSGHLVPWESGDVGYDPATPYRNSFAKYVVSNIDEWHKAAYYDANSETYWDYATSSNEPPVPVAEGVGAGTAVYDSSRADAEHRFAPITQAGGLGPFGTMGQTGNISELEEVTDINGAVVVRIGGDNVTRWQSALLNRRFERSRPGLRLVSLNQPEPRLGDINGDRIVNFDDFVILANKFGMDGHRGEGDFDGDGLVDFDDFVILANAFDSTADVQGIPEPSSDRLTGFAILALLSLHRRLPFSRRLCERSSR